VNSDKLEDRMRRLEYYHGLEALPGAHIVVRVDGRSFTKLTRGMEHPFDLGFHGCMVETATALLIELGGLYAFTESDEISVLLPSDTDLFGRSLEKLVSVSAGIASSTFSLGLGRAGHFDSRVWVGVSEVDVIDYFRWRQADASRCCLNSWCYWTLRKHGSNAKDATERLEGKSFSAKNELLFKHGVNFNNVPTWQKRGVGLYWEDFEKAGFNPRTKQQTLCTRRAVYVDKELPRGAEYVDLLTRVVGL
jgi:tRNA(His) guanylyltransferase